MRLVLVLTCKNSQNNHVYVCQNADDIFIAAKIRKEIDNIKDVE